MEWGGGGRDLLRLFQRRAHHAASVNVAAVELAYSSSLADNTAARLTKAAPSKAAP